MEDFHKKAAFFSMKASLNIRSENAILTKNANFRPKTDQEAIARQSVKASHEVICAYFW